MSNGTWRGVATVVLASAALVGVSGLARAQSGSIADVHSVGGGQVQATFTSTSTECTPYGFCGWFPLAWQVAASSPCSTAGTDIVYVGDYQDASGTQTATRTFFKQFEPVKICLDISAPAGGYEPVAEVTYSFVPAEAPPPPPPPPTPPAGPTLIAPVTDARVPAAASVQFRVETPQADDLVSVEVSRSPALDPDGTLANADVVDSGYADGDTAQSAELDGDWTRHPGTYWWQASRLDCNEDGSDCNAESDVRRLEIVQPALRFAASTRGRQRLVRGYGNLVLKLRCNRDCDVQLTGHPSYRQGRTRRGLRGLTLSDLLNLKAGRTDAYGFSFTAAERARMTAVMRRHGPIRWRMELHATTHDGDARSVTRYIQMVPPPLPRPRRPAVSPPSRPSCDPSYPDVCIPPPPPDLDCADIPYRNFRVIGADPHRFDGDGDGIGCES